jgi:hypothetical protein
MSILSPTRAAFLEHVFRSSFPGQVAIRFAFAEGEVGALYTMGQDPTSRQACPVVRFVATFPPSIPYPGHHDHGIDYYEQPVASADEAAHLLAQFDHAAAVRFRTHCRPPASREA